MRTVSAAGPRFLSSRHLSLAERLHHAAVLFRIPKRVLFFLSPSAAAALPLFCLQIFLARRSSDPQTQGASAGTALPCSGKREWAENEKRGEKVRGHGARAGGRRSVNTNGGEGRRAQDKQMPEEMCLSESHTGGRGGRMWLERQITSFTKHELHRQSQTWRSSENESWLPAMTAGDINICEAYNT